MKRKSLLLMLTIIYHYLSWGQAAQTTPDGTLIANQNANAAMPTSAILELRSANKGMLPPRMTTQQIDAIASPATGLMIYDTEAKCLKAFNGTQWQCANANVVASTPLSSSYAFLSVTDNNALSEAIVADNTGNTVSVGSFAGAVTFGKTGNSMTLTSLGNFDGFIVKHDKDGNLIWATQIGGAQDEQRVVDVAMDNSGNIAVTGYLKYATNFYSTDGGVSSYTNNGSYSKIFVAKYNSSGALLWFKVESSSGNYDCRGRGVNFDQAGNIVSTGEYRGVVAFDATNLTSISNTEDIFIAKYDGSNGNILWVKTAGGNSNDESGHEIVCDAANNIYILGYYSATATFGEAPGAINFTSRGSTDIFIMKYSGTGTFTWAKTAGSTGDEEMGGITYSAIANAIYVCGSYKNTLSFGSGLGTNPQSSIGSSAYYNGFLAKYDLNGNIAWSTKQGTTNNNHNFYRDIDVDTNGNTYLCAEIQYDTRFYGTSSTTDYFSMKGVGYREPAIAKYNSSGALQWAICAVDGYDEFMNGISVKNNIVFTFGNFRRTLNFGYQQLRVINPNEGYYGDLFIWCYQE